MKKVLLTLLIMISCHLYADNAFFNHFGTQNGLTDDNVRAIIEDKSGYIWIGTRSGLYRFDGLTFEKIDTSAIASIIQVRFLFVDQDNTLLIGTSNHGLLSYNSYGIKKYKGLNGSNITVNAMIKGPEKQLWLATNSGLFKHSTKNTLEKITSPSLNFLQNIKIDTIEKLNNENIAITTQNKIHIYHQKVDTIKTITLDEGHSVHDLHQDELGILWIATSKKLFRYDWKNNRQLSAPQLTNATRVLSIGEYHDDMWIATIDGGLFKIDKESLLTQQFLTQRNSPYSLSENNIMTVYITSSGMLWAGGFANGLNSLNLNLSGFNYHKTTSNSLNCTNDPHTFSIKTDATDTLWLGNGSGLIKWQQQSHKCELINVISNSDITNFTVLDTQIGDDGLWVGSSVGLLRYDNKTDTLATVNKKLNDVIVFFIHQEDNQQLLLGTNAGIFEYNIIHKTLNKLPLPDKKFNNLSFRKYAADTNGGYFFSSDKGLLHLTKERHLQEFRGLENTFIDKKSLM